MPPIIENGQQIPHGTPYHPETIYNGNGYELVTGGSNPQLAKDIGAILQQTIDEPIAIFRDGERKQPLLRVCAEDMLSYFNHPLLHSSMIISWRYSSWQTRHDGLRQKK